MYLVPTSFLTCAVGIEIVRSPESPYGSGTHTVLEKDSNGVWKLYELAAKADSFSLCGKSPRGTVLQISKYTPCF